MKRFATALIVLPLMLPCVGIRAAYGLELTVTDNGSGSTSEVSAVVEQTATVVQSNDTNINNEVGIEADTGSNNVSGNGGEIAVETGDVNITAEVTNEVNNSAVNLPCCEASGETVIEVSGNGEGSTTQVNYTNEQATEVFVNQQAIINNILSGTLNTGNNTASNNGGNVTIETGSISGNVNLTNIINSSQVQVSTGSNGEIIIKVNQNGTNSQNLITLSLVDGVLVVVDNQAEVNNSVNFDLNTGNNTANDNQGEVWIKTGDIDFAIITENLINQDEVIIDKCCEVEPIDPDDPPDPPEDPPVDPDPPESILPPTRPENKPNDKDDDPDDDSGVGGVSDAEVLGAMLPATGTMDYMLAVVANILMFLLGVYLRLKSGRAPAIS